MNITKKKKILPVAAKPVVAKPKAVEVDVEVLQPLGGSEPPASASAAERIAFHLEMAKRHTIEGFGHFVRAGHGLFVQKQSIGYGNWDAWTEQNLHVSKKTADRYVAFYCRIMGPLRAASGIPLTAEPTADELKIATIGMEQKSATRAMIDLEIIKRPKNWGGKREDAGRKKKVEAKEVKAALDAVAQNETLLWNAAKSALDTLVQLDADRDFLRRLSDDHLATVVSILGELSDKAAQIFQTRISTPAAGMLPNREGNTAIATPEPRPSVGTGDV